MIKLIQLGAIAVMGSVAVFPPATNATESWIYWGVNIETPNFGMDFLPTVTFQYVPSGKEIVQKVQEKTNVTLPGSWRLTDKEIICAIGSSEGTRDRNCQATRAYYGHSDPGNRKWNMGTFSYQHGASTPEEADQKWLPVLRKAENDMQFQAKEKFGKYLSPKAIAAGLDSYTQSPHSSKFYVGYLPSANPTFDQVVAARTKALNKSRSILGGARLNVPADQKRRVSRVWEQVHR
jgi:hypothetical protein